jgi:hypothetical protein
LQSERLRDIAWGAYVVAERRLPGCEPLLRGALARASARIATDGGQCAALAVLDALIGTDAVVPARELEPLLPWADAVLVLAARDVTANRALLVRLGSPRGPFMDETSAACGDLLARLRDSDFLRALLLTPLELCVLVHDVGEPRDLEGIGSGWDTACGRRPQPKGFPPIARYRAFPTGTGVGFHRGRYHGGLHCESFETGDGFRAARRRWLVAMLGDAIGARSDALDAPVAHAWQDRATLDAYAAQLRTDAERTWREFVAACVDAKLFAADAAPATPPLLHVSFLDDRKRPEPALPDAMPPWFR